MNKIKVVHINTSGIGGAAIACHRLHHLMLDNGISSNVIHLYTNHKHETEFYSIGYKAVRRYTNHLMYDITQRDLKPEAYVFSEMAPMASGIANHPLVHEADVIYLHWVLGGFFSKSDFEELAKLGKPVFCFTHDMWWITGGCHYAFDCSGYKVGCTKCPLHKHFSCLTKNQAEWKRQFYAKYLNVRLIAPSDWLRRCADESSVIDKGRCDFIPNVVPDSIFKYRDKMTAREQLGIPQDKIIISFGTADNSNWVKGFVYLQEALNSIAKGRILLCVYGSDYDDELASKLNHPIKFLGRLDPEMVAMANAAADLFVSPTLSESFGLTLLENIKCGTPVISTNVTAVPEIVKDKISGYLVEPKNSMQIVKAILSFIEDPMRIDGTCDEMFSDTSIISRHIEVITKALSLS